MNQTTQLPNGLTATRAPGQHRLHRYAVDTDGKFYFFDQHGPQATFTWIPEPAFLAADRPGRAHGDYLTAVAASRNDATGRPNFSTLARGV